MEVTANTLRNIVNEYKENESKMKEEKIVAIIENEIKPTMLKAAKEGKSAISYICNSNDKALIMYYLGKNGFHTSSKYMCNTIIISW